MADEAELQARIAALSGRITHHKQQQQQQPPQSYRGSPRWSPYGRGGGRAAFAGPPPHRHRTLVNDQRAAAANEGFVSTRGTNNQLMTKDTYEREQKQHKELKAQHRADKRQKRNVEEQDRILRQMNVPGQEANREMVIDGLRFQLSADGSKLIRLAGKKTREPALRTGLNSVDGPTDTQETPKRAKIAGIHFYRTKHGNLIRASALSGALRYTRQAPQCEQFTKHGTCQFGSRCRFAHDPNKVAVCKTFVKRGDCSRGDSCDLSHDITYHRVPACTYFLRGNCIDDACRYPHVHVSPAASVCRPFATLGYCAKGADCDKSHVIECPDYANHGFCAKHESGKCLLPHIDHASVLRKAAGRQAKMSASASQDGSDLSSNAEEPDDAEDVDSDMEMLEPDWNSHELSQQQDFVGFS